MAFGSSVLTHKKEQQIKIAGEFKPTVDCLCAIRRGFVAVYGKIRKVYSIWICTQPSDGFENTLTRYSIKPEQLIGEAQEETENYDLMSVVMICLGKPGTENHKGI